MNGQKKLYKHLEQENHSSIDGSILVFWAREFALIDKSIA